MMVKLSIDQQSDEIRDVENFIKDLDPIAVVELQSQQVRRLIYFAKKGVNSYKSYKARFNPELNKEIMISDDGHE
jgi:hypothetical protein